MKNSAHNVCKIKINIKEVYKEITGKEKNFPKYTTQLINLANQNAQATRPKVVGQMSELIKQCQCKSFNEWRNWYLKRYPYAIKNATEKIMSMIEKMKIAMNKINQNMVQEWVEDLVINKTAEGFIIQEIILKLLAEKFNVNYRTATPKEESKNIDGFLGERPIQIKSLTYISKKSSVREKIRIPIIYYEKKRENLWIYYNVNELEKL
ncbi:MAG: MjaI family restriction endonuclease [Promethearchaeota archaeon]